MDIHGIDETDRLTKEKEAYSHAYKMLTWGVFSHCFVKIVLDIPELLRGR